MTDYHTRLATIRAGLDQLHRTQRNTDLPRHLADQLQAAHRDAFDWLNRLGAVEAQLDPGRWTRGSETSNDIGRVIDTQARVLAAMGDGHRWRVCIHLRRTPAQPAYVLLPLRRIDCRRCTSTIRHPPADEDDRCDLCGARGIQTFWPLRLAASTWVVLGDICRECAQATHNPAAA